MTPELAYLLEKWFYGPDALIANGAVLLFILLLYVFVSPSDLPGGRGARK